MLQRQAQASAWPADGSPVVFRPDDPAMARYGPMYDELGRPVQQAEAWKSPDGRINVRYLDANGAWSQPKPVVGDNDSFRTTGTGQSIPSLYDEVGLAPDGHSSLPYRAGAGTIPGEGDFTRWVDSSIDPATGAVKADVSPALLLKQYQVGLQATEAPVLRVDKNGVFLVQPDLSREMGALGSAIRTVDPSSWTPAQLQQLQAYGLAP
jgi:hypothetical protein